MAALAVAAGIIGGGFVGWWVGIAICPDHGDIGIGAIPWALGGAALGAVVGGAAVAAVVA